MTRDSGAPRLGGPYPEEILLEAYNIEWEAIELRRQRLQKMWQQVLLTEKMEEEDKRYRRQLRKLEQQEQQQKARQEAERLASERIRQAIATNKEREQNQSGEDTATEEERILPAKVKAAEVKKPKKTTKKVEKTKRITPVSLPTKKKEEPEMESLPAELDGYDSPLPELPADDLLNVLSMDKGSDSDLDDEPSMISLILPVSQSSPKRDALPVKKKTMTPQKRMAKKGAPIDFNFTNAEARRQAKAAKAAEQDSDDDDTEPETMPSPAVLTPKKRLKRRKDAAKERLKAHNEAGSTGKSLMAAMAKTTVAVKTKKTAGKVVTTKQTSKAGTTMPNAIRKKASGATVASRKVGQKKGNPQTAEVSTEEEADVVPTQTKKPTTSGKMTIKQRLANAEMLTRMSKMQDISTPKVLSKKASKTQMNAGAKAKRADFRKILSNDEVSESRRDEAIEERDLNISLNSSFSGGQISDDDDFPDDSRVTKRKKRKRAPVTADATPAKKQFLEITKRLVKSPMPRYLRTPTPLMSPVVAPALIKPTASSPNPRGISGRGATAAKEYASRRMNGGPSRAKQTISANRFGIPPGGVGGGAASAGGMSIFDAFVSSGSGGAIPRLKLRTRGDESPTV